LRKVRAGLPSGAVIEIRMGLSQDIHEMFDAGRLDAAVVRREGGGSEGEILGEDQLGWRAAESWTMPAGGPVPLATLGAPCGVRAAAIRQLDNAKIPWREAFIGGSCAALLAGVRAGLGVAPMGQIASGDVPDCGPTLGLPAMPESEIVLFARASSPAASSAIRALAAAIRSGLR
jgi:DNA-binding transcriptional LysR family regulator